ncbi:MAG: hypothetical protein JWO78_1169 [Micavibrio sp.]|nr:hypothetical protein [Micavibrio sp.]
MKTGIFKTLGLAAMTAGAVFAAMPRAEARVIVNINNGYPVQQCDGYTRTYIDGYGYQRTAQGTACLQPNGEWVVVWETLLPVYNTAYIDRTYYRDVPSYYVRPSVIYYNDRNTHWSRNDRHDRHDNGRHNGRHN